jgi:hypothetical protein
MARSIASHPRLGLAFALALVALLLSAGVPVLDEESYLDIARQLDPARPYDWSRPWQPYGAVPEPDAFVYAHPPLFLLWAHLWGRAAQFAPGAVAAIKVAMALPWAALLGWSVGRLAERCLSRPWLAVGAYCAAPIVILGVQRGLMPDLMVTALSTFAFVAFVEAVDSVGGFSLRWQAMGGIALGAAAATKYPALLLAPALLFFAQERQALGRGRVFWACALGLFLGVELWLFFVYGRVHLLYVLQRADEIARGSLEGRGLGVLARLALAASPIALLLGLRPGLSLGLGALGLGALALGMPEGSGLELILSVGAFALCGAVALAPLVQGLASPAPDLRRSTLRSLSCWGLLVIGGVVLGHNFSAPRYLLPAVAPILLVGAAAAEHHARRRALWHLGAALHGLLGLALTVAEHRFFTAGAELAAEVARSMPAATFAGEWSFRHGLSQAGWRFYSGALPPGARLVSPTESSPPELPAGLVRERVWVAGEGLLRVVDAERGIGLYGETIGPLPFGLGAGPLEAVTLWRVP